MTEKALPQFIHHESSPLGNILLAADEVGLTGLWFEGQKNYARTLFPESGERELPAHDSLWEYCNIRRDCQTACGGKRACASVRAGGRRRGRAKPDFHPDSLS